MIDARAFGRRLFEAPTTIERLALHAAEDRRGDARAIDATIEDLIVRGLAGERIVTVAERYDDETVELPTLGEAALQTIAAHVDVGAMERRGAWALPERETVVAGHANFSWWVRQQPLYVGSLADDERKKMTLRGNTTGTFAWAAVMPIFETLAIPHDLRAAKAGKADVPVQEKAWMPLDAMLESCGIDLIEELAPFRPRSGWSRLSPDQRADVRLRLIDGWARHATPEIAARLRMWMLSRLVDRFYAKAKTGTPTSRQALTKAYWRPMVALFGGDWLSLLAYLGEQPNPGEEVHLALPKPKLFVTGSERAHQAAADAGIDAAEVDRMLASFFGARDGTSPVERRVAVLKRAWQALDEVHAGHTPSAGSLSGLFDERGEVHDTRFDDQYRKGLHREVLPSNLNQEIAALWGTMATTRNPDRLVTRPLPHHGVWESFGAALQFWHQVALTAYAHTEATGYWEWGLSAVADRHKESLDAMSAAGCPVDRSFFTEIAAAARELGPIEHERHVSRIERGDIAIELSISGGERLKRPGFERLRDVITRHRRAWAEAHLDGWLAQRWQPDLLAAAAAFNRVLVAKGKPPTVRQSINASQPGLDRWFDGDIRQLLSAIGQEAPAGAPVYERHLPADPYRFGKAVEYALGGGRPEPDRTLNRGNREQAARFRAIRQHNTDRYYAAFTAYEYVKTWEALGERPEMKQVKSGKSGAEYLNRSDPDAGWRELEQAILKVLADPDSPVVERAALPFARAGDDGGDEFAAAPSDPTAAEHEPSSDRKRGLLGRLLGRH